MKLFGRYWCLFLGICVFLGTAQVAHAQQCDGALSRGLVGHWKLEEASGTALDSSPSGHDGTIAGTGQTQVGGYLGQAFRAGGDRRVDVSAPAPFSAYQPYTVSVWVNPFDTHPVNRGGAVYSTSQNYAGACDRHLLFVVGDYSIANNNRPGAKSYSGGSTLSSVLSSNNVPLDTWTHVTYVYDGTNMNIYVNGVLDTSEAFLQPDCEFGDRNAIIGRYDHASSNYSFRGDIDDVRVYNRALTAAEIKNLYELNAGAMRYNAESSAVEYCDGENWVMAGTGSYSPTAVTFDGTNDYLTRDGDFTGNSDSKMVTGSVWFRTSNTNNRYIFDNSSNRFRVAKNSLGRFVVIGDNSASAEILNAFSSNGQDDGEWRHALFSFDLADPTRRHLYINGASDLMGGTHTDDEIDLTVGNHWIGAIENPGGVFDGDIADFWLDFGTYIDFSSATQRAKFISPNGTPMYLGADGSLPTGEAPDIFLSGDVDTWHINKGTGGGFTENGELTFSSVNPGSPYAEMTDDGLVGWWKFDETSGTTALDSSGNGNNGTFENGLDPTLHSVGGILGSAIDFGDREDNRSISVPHSASLLPAVSDMTISFWMKPNEQLNEIGSTLWRIAHKESGATGWFLAINGYTGHNFRIRTCDGVSCDYNILSPSINWQPDVWHHITVIFDGANNHVSFYKDGSFLGTDSTNVNTSIDFGSAPLLIGEGIFNSDAQGLIDDFRIYNRALTAPEVQAIYDAAFCTGPAGMIGDIHYNIDHKLMQYCTGRDWVAMAQRGGGTGGGGCVVPAGIAGDLMFNDDWDVMQFCNGEDWVAIGKVAAPTSGLVGYWKLDEASGNFIDSAGANDGTNIGGVAYRSGGSAKLGYAAGFDGVDGNDIRVTGFADDMSVAGTYAYWAKVDSYRPSSAFISAPGSNLLFMDATGLFRVFLARNSNSSLINSDSGYLNGFIPLNEWYHTTVVYDSTSVRIYKNGQLIYETVPPAEPSFDSPTTYYFGSDRGIAGRVIDGYLDEVRIYNRALDAGEVKALFWATR